jgi:Skp family chaperone for outer membrane proteins
MNQFGQTLRGLLAGVGVTLLASTAAFGQTTQPGRFAILTIEQGMLLSQTQYGKTITLHFEQELRALAAENTKIDSELSAEEQKLTDLRPTIAAANFRALADAFDKKVEALRATQEAKSRNLNAQQDAERKKFFDAVGPILGDMMVDLGAAVILDKGSIVVSLGAIDVTDQAVARIDAVLKDGK